MNRNVLKIVAGLGLLVLAPAAALAQADGRDGFVRDHGYAPAYRGPATFRHGYHDDYRWHRDWHEPRWHPEHGGHPPEGFRR
jgi:hypothetical protein